MGHLTLLCMAVFALAQVRSTNGAQGDITLRFVLDGNPAETISVQAGQDVGALDVAIEILEEQADGSKSRATSFQDTVEVKSTLDFVEPQNVNGDEESQITSTENLDFTASNFGIISRKAPGFYPDNQFIFQAGTLKLEASYKIFNENDDLLSIQKADTTITVTARDASVVEISSDATTAEASNAITITFEVRDEHGNIVKSFSQKKGTVSTSSNNPSYTAATTFSEGVATVQMSNSVAEDVNVSYTHSGLSITGIPLELSWTPGITQKFTLSITSDLPEVNNVPYLEIGQDAEVTIIARDASNNRVRAEDKSIGLDLPSGVTVTSSVQTLNNKPAVTFANGKATFTITSSVGLDAIIRIAIVEFYEGSPSFAATTEVRFVDACDGQNTYRGTPSAIECDDVRDVCPIGSKEVQAPNTTQNRICEECDGVTEFQDQADQDFCYEMGPACEVGFGELVKASPSTNRTCYQCNATIEYQDQAGQADCLPIKECTSGQEIAVEATPSSDRECRSCPAGTADTDQDPFTPCEICSPDGLVAFATVNLTSNDVNVTGTINFAEVLVDGTVDITVDLVADASMSISSWKIEEHDCLFPAANTHLDLSAKFPSPALQSIQNHDELTLVGLQSVYGRALKLTLQHTGGTTEYCADIDAWEELPQFSGSAGNTKCNNIKVCEVGSAQSRVFSRSQNRRCAECDGEQEYQPFGDKNDCYPITQCIAEVGFKELTAPTTSSDRECERITCPALEAPEFGVVKGSPCNNTNVTADFGTVCETDCKPTFVPIAGDSILQCDKTGEFQGELLTCVCPNTLLLDPIREVCGVSCGTGTFKSENDAGESICDVCSDVCEEGNFESTPCAPLTNRECTECSVCGPGTFKSGGCIPTSNNDTICSPFTPCEPGFYETEAGTPTTDRVCSKCFECPSASSFTSSGCCGTTNSQCSPLTLSCLSDEFELSPPEPAPQGGFQSDRKCQKYKSCGAGEYYAFLGNSSADRDCQACTTCPDGFFAANPCVQGSTSSLGSDTDCQPWKTCPEGEYMYWPGTAHVDGECAECRSCGMHEYVASPCNGTQDTVCELKTVCDPYLEYEIDGGNETADRQCATCTVCEDEGLVIQESCTYNTNTLCVNASDIPPEDVNCDRGTVLIGVYPNSFCVPCNDCPSGQYAEFGPLCRTNLTFNAPNCSDWSECGEGTYAMTEPTATTDRVCKTCTKCASDEYAVGGCNGKNDTLCVKQDPCGDDQYEVTASNGTAPHECAACRSCNFEAGEVYPYLASGEYESVACYGQQDRVCSKITPCAHTSAVLGRATPTSNRVCFDCDRRALGLSRSIDPYTCPPFAEDFCPTEDEGETTASPFANHYILVSFSLEGDFNIIVVDTPERIQRFIEDLTEQYNEYLSGIQGNVTMEDVEVSAGSINVKGSIVGAIEDIDSFLDTVGNATELEDFAMEYESSIIGVVEGSASVDLITTSTTTTATRTTTTTVKTTRKRTTAAPTETSVVTEANTTTTLPTTTTTTTPEPEVGSSDSSLSDGALGGIVVAAVVGLIICIAVVMLVMRRSGDSDSSPRKKSDDGDEEGYLGVGVDEEDDGLFGNQIAAENKKLRNEVADMRSKVLMKDAALSHQSKSQQAAEAKLDKAIAARIAMENEQIKKEIGALKSKAKVSKPAAFQKAAANQAKLLAEKAQLEEEIRRANEIEQLAIQAISSFDDDDDDDMPDDMAQFE